MKNLTTFIFVILFSYHASAGTDSRFSEVVYDRDYVEESLDVLDLPDMVVLKSAKVPRLEAEFGMRKINGSNMNCVYNLHLKPSTGKQRAICVEVLRNFSSPICVDKPEPKSGITCVQVLRKEGYFLYEGIYGIDDETFSLVRFKEKHINHESLKAHLDLFNSLNNNDELSKMLTE